MGDGTSVGLVPLCDMGPGETYRGEVGGLYGRYLNTPPKDHLQLAMKAASEIRPLDAGGNPSPDGRVVLVSIGMSNTTQAFSHFAQMANRDPAKSPYLSIVDGAQNGRTSEDWAHPAEGTQWDPWRMMVARLVGAGVTPEQVQAGWVKLTRKVQKEQGEFPAYVMAMHDDVARLLATVRSRLPNLKLVYLSSRTYGGYATTLLNPEPYAYEGAFAMRRVIQDQIEGTPDLNCDPAKGEVKAPVILWGPYLWADGVRPRNTDGLVWLREDFESDGTHPSESGRIKVARLLLNFLKSHPTARPWFRTP
jgi:hypothetical protein